ncbi:MAG: NCS2 family permease [Neisseriaceae bacterium]|nr:NCS2 family permease [Neisseriaceae bacterium]MBP6860791.1 NCS2 family permease [Neisseriaceae bacterium]
MQAPHTKPEGLLARYFKLAEHGTSVRTEVLAGLTTFLTMCYIVIVNPTILSNAGMDYGAVFVATCLSAALGCLVMGLVANYPVALAPGMGVNAFFTYAIVKGMGVPWEVAMGAVFITGLLFVAVHFMKVRAAIVDSIPESLKHAIAAGIGLFLALVALKNAGLVIGNPDTLVKLGDIQSPGVMLAMLGFLLIIVLDFWRVRGAIIISILVVTAISIGMGLTEFKGIVSSVPSLEPTLMKMNLADAFSFSMLGVIFVLFVVSLFDSTGTLVAVAQRAGLMKDNKLPRLNKALSADSAAIVAGAALGTTPTVAYMESVSGTAVGGRTGLTTVVIALLFMASLWFSPLAASVPEFATAPALLYVAILMVRGVVDIDWEDMTEAAPAFVTIVAMPFTYSIADGVAFGFLSYTLIKLFTGRAREVKLMVWVVALMWAAKFVFLGA